MVFITTGDGAEKNDTVDFYWERSSRIWRCRSLLGTMLKRMTLYISTWDVEVGYGAVYLYWRRCGRLPHCRSLLGTVQ